MFVNLNTVTDGKGYRSEEKRKVNIYELDLNYINEEGTFGSLDASFDSDDWNVRKHGLIYTDKLWLKTFREELIKTEGFTEEATNDITYSEQGLQGENHVNLDVGEVFLKFFLKKEII
jgi:hypothetical protein